MVGVYELYQDLGPARAVRPLVWGATHGGFALLLVALLGVVQAAAVLIRRQQQTLSHHAFHDGLTDLPNRALFLDRVGHALARRAQDPIAVLYLNVDGLKLVNDSLGHVAGDRVLLAVAERLAACVDPGDTVARLGNDEFSILLEDVRDAAAAAACATNILDVLRTPVVVDGRELFPTASIGIAVSTAETGSAEGFLREADTAMSRAKARGKDGYEVFNASMVTSLRDPAPRPTSRRSCAPRYRFRRPQTSCELPKLDPDRVAPR